ncbi:MAG TPA: ABC transporter permease [bacterium]|nr:ABC transporter permease [bacterium]
MSVPDAADGGSIPSGRRLPRIVIQPSRGLLHVDWRGLAEYRDLLVLLVRRDFLSRYKQSILGPAWFVIQPVLTTVVFTVIFGNVAKLPSDGMPKLLFYLCALVPWNYFAANLNATSTTFTANISLFGKVYFPRLVVPLSAVVSNLIAFAIQLLTFLAFFTYFKFFSAAGPLIRPNVELLLMPLLVVQTAAVSLGFGLLVTALTVKYQDLVYAMAFLIQLWMYATPVVYPLSMVTNLKWRIVAALNPMTAVVELFKHAFLGVGTVSPRYTLISVAMTLLVLFLGLVMFNRAERTFVDTV